MPQASRSWTRKIEANDGHGRARIDAELIAAYYPREQLYLITVTDAGQP
jgi:hypothetical protein